MRKEFSNIELESSYDTADTHLFYDQLPLALQGQIPSPQRLSPPDMSFDMIIHHYRCALQKYRASDHFNRTHLNNISQTLTNLVQMQRQHSI